MPYITQKRKGEELNRLYQDDSPIHEWYRFVLSYPPHLVRDYIERFDLTEKDCVLDPFCGTGTTVVECKKQGIPSIGIEANPVVHFAAQTKTRWNVSPDGLVEHASKIAEAAERVLVDDGIVDKPLFQPHGKRRGGLRKLDEEQERLLIKGSISPLPLHKVLVLQENLRRLRDDRFNDHEQLALAKQLVYSISNLRFGPEVGAGKAKEDALVVGAWLSGVRAMADDLKGVQGRRNTPASVHHADARQLQGVLKRNSVDAVITSPPYPNEKDYSRTTRLEAVLFGFMKDRKDLRQHKSQFIRSNTRNVYKADTDGEWVTDNRRVQELADKIEARRIELGKTSGFEKLYGNVVRLYFGGMARHLEELKPALRPGAQLAYVVGDQASYFRILIRTGEILAEIAAGLGYEVEGIDLFRTRFSTATQEHLREEVVVLRWNP